MSELNVSLKANPVIAAVASTDIIPKTILVVDDRADDIRLVELMLSRARIENPVQTVGTVGDALSYLKGEGMYAARDRYPVPSLVLLDLHLPDGSGLDILRWIQANPLHAPTGVVVLTGSDIGQIKQSYALGAHSFLVKPLKFSDFRNMMDHIRGFKLIDTSEGYLMDVE